MVLRYMLDVTPYWMPFTTEPMVSERWFSFMTVPSTARSIAPRIISPDIHIARTYDQTLNLVKQEIDADFASTIIQTSFAEYDSCSNRSWSVTYIPNLLDTKGIRMLRVRFNAIAVTSWRPWHSRECVPQLLHFASYGTRGTISLRKRTLSYYSKQSLKYSLFFEVEVRHKNVRVAGMLIVHQDGPIKNGFVLAEAIKTIRANINFESKGTLVSQNIIKSIAAQYGTWTKFGVSKIP